MSTYSFYNPETGFFSGTILSISDCASLRANTPSGCIPIEGKFDHLSQRVNLATGEVIDWQPPAPPNDEMQTWTWDPGPKRWISNPTPAAIAKRARAERDVRLAKCDWVVAKAVETGEAVPAEWAAYRKALRDLPSREGFPDGIEWPAPPA